MSKSYESIQPRFLTENSSVYVEEIQQQQRDALDRGLSDLTRIPESDEVLAMDADPEDSHLPEHVKAALVMAARVRRNIQ